MKNVIIFLVFLCMLTTTTLTAQTKISGRTIFTYLAVENTSTENAVDISYATISGLTLTDDATVPFNYSSNSCRGIELTKNGEPINSCSLCSVVDADGDTFLYISRPLNGRDATFELQSGSGKYANLKGSGEAKLDHATADGKVVYTWNMEYKL